MYVSMYVVCMYVVSPHTHTYIYVYVYTHAYVLMLIVVSLSPSSLFEMYNQSKISQSICTCIYTYILYTYSTPLRHAEMHILPTCP